MAECVVGMGERSARLVRLGLPDEFVEHGGRGELLKRLGLAPEGIARSCAEALESTLNA